MTKKEIALQNYYEALIAAGCSEPIARFRVYRERRTSIAELEEKTRARLATAHYNEAVEKREEYYETPEGKEFKEKIEAQLKAESTVIQNLHDETVKKIARAFDESITMVGSYVVTDISKDRIVLQPAPDTYYCQIEICWPSYYSREYGKDVEPTINVSARGSISVKQDSNERSYYINVGILFTKYAELQKIYNEHLVGYEAALKERYKVTDGLRAQLKNPLSSEYIH